MTTAATIWIIGALFVWGLIEGKHVGKPQKAEWWWLPACLAFWPVFLGVGLSNQEE